jgi:hypothetical protein
MPSKLKNLVVTGAESAVIAEVGKSFVAHPGKHPWLRFFCDEKPGTIMILFPKYFHKNQNNTCWKKKIDFTL